MPLKNVLLAPWVQAAIFFILSLVLQEFWIRVQLHEKFTQAQKSYGLTAADGVDLAAKAATPSMGGVVYLVLAFVAALWHSWTLGLKVLLFWSLPIACGLIGLADDGLKFFSHSSEGFRSLAKLRLQLIVCAVWTLLTFLDGRLAFWPELKGPWGILNHWALTIPMAFLASAGMVNSVNITDGLDGLAGGCTLISLVAASVLLSNTSASGLSVSNCLAIVVLFSMVAGFLFFNLRPARTFMGDTGANFLGGALAALCIMNGRLLALLPVGFLFIIEMLSSGIQIFTIRKFNRKVFLIAPLHHHFQRKGWSETKVTERFWLAHALGAAWLTLVLLAI